MSVKGKYLSDFPHLVKEFHFEKINLYYRKILKLGVTKTSYIYTSILYKQMFYMLSSFFYKLFIKIIFY